MQIPPSKRNRQHSSEIELEESPEIIVEHHQIETRMDEPQREIELCQIENLETEEYMENPNWVNPKFPTSRSFTKSKYWKFYSKDDKKFYCPYSGCLYSVDGGNYLSKHFKRYHKMQLPKL